MTIPQDAEHGTWTVQNLNLTDQVGNNRNLDTTHFAALGFPNTFHQTGVGDLTAPTLTAFAISPTTIDTSTAPQTITVTATITDDHSGNAASLIEFRSPSGQYANAWLDPAHRVSGTPQNGNYAYTMTIPQDAEHGTWTVQNLNLTDQVGNNRNLDTTHFAALGFPNTFHQTGVGDLTAPTLSAFAISPTTIDTSTAPQTITVTATITDDHSGNAASLIEFRSPSGQYANAWLDPAHRVSGTPQNGNYAYTMTIPQDAEHGTWTVQNLNLTDQVGNNRNLDTTHFAALGYASGFTNGGLTETPPPSGAGDSTAPSLTAFAISPTTIDTSTGAQAITITATITDDLTGNANSNGIFRSPSGEYASVNFDSTHRTSGTAQNGTYTATVTLPQASEQGTWTLQDLILNDQVGNSQYLNTTQIANLGYPTTFQQTGVGDLTAPTLTAFAISPTTIDTSTGAQAITITATITDDLTGNANSNGIFRSPSGEYASVNFDSTHRTSGTAQNGTYTATVTLPQASEQGTWTLQDLILNDQVGNSQYLNTTQIANLGYPTTFQQTGVGDLTAPTLTAFAISPTTIDTSTGAQAITITATITDDLTGNANSNGIFRSPSGEYASVNFDSTHRTSGTAQNGTYTATVTLPQASEQGTWTLQDLILNDQVGNSQYLNTTQIANLGYPTTFTNGPA